MNPERRNDYKEKLYELVPEDGRPVSNKEVRARLADAFPEENFIQDDYWDLRRPLIEDGRLAMGRGYSGTVRRVPSVVPLTTGTAPDGNAPTVLQTTPQAQQPPL